MGLIETPIIKEKTITITRMYILSFTFNTNLYVKGHVNIVLINKNSPSINTLSSNQATKVNINNI